MIFIAILFSFLFCGHVLFQFLSNLQQYCDSAYNKLNSHQQEEFINITKLNYIGGGGGGNRRERERETFFFFFLSFFFLLLVLYSQTSLYVL